MKTSKILTVGLFLALMPLASLAPAQGEIAAPINEPLFGFFPGGDSIQSKATVKENYDRISNILGEPQVYRVFNTGLPQSPFKGSRADFGPPVVVSFKANPTAVVAGTYDKTLTTWFESIPADRLVWWSYWHEPENDIEDGDFTAEEYRAAWNHLLTLAPKRENLRSTLILMQYSLIKKTRNVEDYIVPDLDVLAWDSYLSKDEKDAEEILGEAAAISKAHHMGFGVAEVSVLDARTAGLDREAVLANFVKELKTFARANDAQFVTWFETVKEQDWRISIYPSAVQAWKEPLTPPPPPPVDNDLDNDGLSNERENKLGTNPKDRDTDNDRLGDGREILKLKTNPLRKDTDRDGLNDRREIRVTHTNPRKKDTDGDSVNDRKEIRNHTNPRNPKDF